MIWPTFALKAIMLISSVFGASGAVFGLLLAFGVLHPNSTVMLVFPPIAMKAKWFVVVYGLIELLFGLSGYQSGVAHFAHLGGMLVGFIILLLWNDNNQGNLLRKIRNFFKRKPKSNIHIYKKNY
jgi:membrane associated rhomboid family serine protease